MQKVSEGNVGRVYLQGYAEFDRHSLILREADKPGLDMFAFKVDSEKSIEDFFKRIEAFGLTVDQVPAGEMPGVGTRIGFMVTTGHRFEVHADMELSEYGYMVTNPEVWREEPRGMKVTRLDHAQLHGPDVEDNLSFSMKVLDFALPETDEEQELQGKSWLEIANSDDDPERVAFSEYHEATKPTGAFMIRRGKYKYNYYVDYEPELFDLDADQEETTNLAGDAAHASTVKEYHGYLLKICDPEKTDRAAKDDQNELVAQFGGPDAAFNTGTPGATPVPGQGHE
jgi:hypothetical protein